MGSRPPSGSAPPTPTPISWVLPHPQASEQERRAGAWQDPGTYTSLNRGRSSFPCSTRWVYPEGSSSASTNQRGHMPTCLDIRKEVPGQPRVHTAGRRALPPAEPCLQPHPDFSVQKEVRGRRGGSAGQGPPPQPWDCAQRGGRGGGAGAGLHTGGGGLRAPGLPGAACGQASQPRASLLCGCCSCVGSAASPRPLATASLLSGSVLPFLDISCQWTRSSGDL